MLGYFVLKARKDMKFISKNGVFYYKKDNEYIGRTDKYKLLIYDERDNACKFGYYQTCFKFRMASHFGQFFYITEKNKAINGKEFYNIRKQLREGN